jgi:molecular chaperone DnaJ
VPQETQPGDILRLHGRGIPKLRGTGRGDQIIIFDVRTPTNLSEKQKELLRQFADIENED